MTTLIRPNEPWSVHPGLGIFVDLTPTEVVNSRQLRVLRKVIVSALVAVMALFLGGYLLAIRSRSSAESALADAQTRTTVLQAQADKFADVTRIGQAVTRIRTQIAKQLTADVAIDSLMNKVRASLPRDMTIRQVSLTISLAGVAGSKAPAAGTTIDASGHTRIGTITLSGTGHTIDDLSEYVDRLKVIAGVVDVVPTSNATSGSGSGVEYSLSFGLDDRLLSHRFDVTKGGK
jgi:Tfp pilus assembly protein PilN